LVFCSRRGSFIGCLKRDGWPGWIAQDEFVSRTPLVQRFVSIHVVLRVPRHVGPVKGALLLIGHWPLAPRVIPSHASLAVQDAAPGSPRPSGWRRSARDYRTPLMTSR
jgi:hypothetical protein